MNYNKELKFDTRTVHGFKGYDENTGAISFPIFQCATFRHPGLHQTSGYDYSRQGNPTREELEKTIAHLENAEYGFAFSTGLAAIDSVLHLFKSGVHFVITDDLYGGTYRLFEELYIVFGFEFTYVDMSDSEAVFRAIKSNTVALFIESPTNPMMKICDISTLCRIAKENNLLTIVDNTFLTPYNQRPIELGADIVIHSGTKYLGGHNDTLAGFVVTSLEKVAERIRLIQKTTGAVLSPIDSWLLLRGIKTLAIRLERQQENAFKLAKWLSENKNVKKVFYPGLIDHAGHELIKKQSQGFGAMISFEVDCVKRVEHILSNLKVIMFAESLGGVESLITYPVTQTHSFIPAEIRENLGINDKLLRLSVGIENINDIIADLDQALED